jgi:hypothetical protein
MPRWGRGKGHYALHYLFLFTQRLQKRIKKADAGLGPYDGPTLLYRWHNGSGGAFMADQYVQFASAIWNEIGAAVIAFLLPLFTIFRDDTFAPALAATLVCLAGVILVYSLVDAIYVRLRLWPIIRLTRSFRTPVEFRHNLDRVDGAMTSIRFLRHAWVEFRETLLEPEQDDPHAVIRNTTRPFDYLNAHEAGAEFGFRRTLSGVFVGVGLLLTFFGLVSALHFATEDIRNGSTNLAQTRDALSGLLHAASFKFYTSIAGLRSFARFVEQGFGILCRELERRMAFATPESIAFLSLKESQEQSRQLSLLNTDIALAIGRQVEQALNNTLSAHLSAAMEPMAAKLEQVTKNLSGMNEGALKEMTENFSRNLHGAAGEQVQALASVLDRLKDTLDGMHEKVDESTAGMADKIGASSDVFAKVVRDLQESHSAMASQVEEAVSRISHAAETASKRVADDAAEIGKALADGTKMAGAEAEEAIRAAASDLSGSLKEVTDLLSVSVKTMTERLSITAQQMADVGASMETHKNAIAEASKSTQKTEAALSATAGILKEAGAPMLKATSAALDATSRIERATQQSSDAMTTTLSALRGVSDALSQTQESILAGWKSYLARFEGVDDSLEQVLLKIIEQADAQAEGLRKFVTDMDTQLAAAVEQLAGGIEGFNETAEGFGDASLRIEEASKRVEMALKATA